MKVTVNTSNYEFANGKKPSGKGNWAFFMGKYSNDVNKAFFVSGKYSDAKKQAQQRAVEMGIGYISVGA